MANFRLFQTERVCRRQFRIWWKWQKDIQTGRKHCGKRRNCSLRENFSFSHSVFKRLVSQGLQKVSLCGNGLNPIKLRKCVSNLFKFACKWVSFYVNLLVVVVVGCVVVVVGSVKANQTKFSIERVSKCTATWPLNIYLNMQSLTLYHIILNFKDLKIKKRSLLKTLWEKQKVLVISIFCFSYNVFYNSWTKFHFFMQHLYFGLQMLSVFTCSKNCVTW